MNELNEILESLYSAYKNGNFYYIPNRKEIDIRNEIKSVSVSKGYNIDMDIYISTFQMNDDVMIKL